MQLGQSSRDLAEPDTFEATDGVDETDDEKYHFASYAKISTTAWIRSVDSISQATDRRAKSILAGRCTTAAQLGNAHNYHAALVLGDCHRLFLQA